MSNPDKYVLPKEMVGDHAHTLARAGIASIPVVGGAGNELFQSLILPPLRKRQFEWMNDIAEGLRKLEETQKCVVDELSDNDTFIDTVMQTSQAVLRTAHQEKRRALRNAVLNSALPNSPDDSQQAVFVQFIDSLTVHQLHYRTTGLVAGVADRSPTTVGKAQWGPARVNNASTEATCLQISLSI